MVSHPGRYDEHSPGQAGVGRLIDQLLAKQWEFISVLIQRADLGLHLRWLTFSVVMATAATLWFLWTWRQTGTWPTGSSPVGFVCGILGGAIIIFECLLWLRKKYRARRWGRMFFWMQAHVWLGLLCLPLLLLHSGFYLGGALSTLLLVLLLIVVISGIVGLLLQQYIPSQMLEWIPQETVHSQIDHVVRSLLEDARLLVEAAAGQANTGSLSTSSVQPVTVVVETQRTVGARPAGGRVRDRILQVELPDEPIPGGARLYDFFRRQFEPFFLAGTRHRSALRSAVSAGPVFDDLRTQIDSSGHGIIDLLERLCLARRQFDLQRRLHGWLHGWLLVHVPLSAALLVLMVMHAFAAMKYW